MKERRMEVYVMVMESEGYERERETAAFGQVC